MATLDVMRSASDYDPAVTKSIKRALDLYASELDYELPPAVKVKTDSPPERILGVFRVTFFRVDSSDFQGLKDLPPNFGGKSLKVRK